MARQKRKPQKGKPITSNPLFPAVVALWFSAVFGLGSLAVRPSLLEDLVIRSRIDLVIPAAAPPLGITARILLALLLAALGGIIGAAFARRLARPAAPRAERRRGARLVEADEPRVRSRDSHPDAPVRRPISAHEELGEEIAAPVLLPGRRRPLAIDERDGPFVPHETVPLPGGQPQILGHDTDEPDEALELGEFTQEPAADAAQLPVSAEPLDWTGVRAAVPFEAEPAPRQDFQLPADAQTNALAGRQVFGMAPVAPQDPAARQIFGMANETQGADVVRKAGYQASVFETPQAPPLFAAPPTPDEARTPGSFADLGMTDLARRLQESMRRRRAARQAASPQASFEAPAEDFAPAKDAEPSLPSADEAAPVLTPLPVSDPVTDSQNLASAEDTPVLTPQPLPAALRPLSLDDFADDDDDDFALASLIPPRHITMAPPSVPAASPEPLADEPDETPPAAEVADAEAAEASDDSYASLLSLRNDAALRTAFVRIDEPDTDSGHVEPVVIFPGQAPRVALPSQPGVDPAAVAPVVSPDPQDNGGFRRFDAPSNAGAGQPVAAIPGSTTIDPEETERALRSALASLQRISGAA